MDLKPSAGDVPDTYATFADLYGYCYLVASVVAWSASASSLQRQSCRETGRGTGIAFPTTDILRDVAKIRSAIASICMKIAEHGVVVDHCVIALAAHRPALRARIASGIGRRAESYYQSAQSLCRDRP